MEYRGSEQRWQGGPKRVQGVHTRYGFGQQQRGQRWRGRCLAQTQLKYRVQAVQKDSVEEDLEREE